MTSRNKVPLKKVDAITNYSHRKKSNPKKRPQGLLTINNQKLSLLPKLVLVAMILAVVLIASWLFLPSNEISDENSVARLVLPPEDQLSQTSRPSTPQDTAIMITNIQNKVCYVIQSFNDLSYFGFNISGIESYELFTPDPNSICEFDLAVVVLVLTNSSQQRSELNTYNNPSSDVVSLNSDITVLVKGSQSKPEIEESEFQILLGESSVSQSKDFDAATAFSQIKIDTNHYYLAGGCQAPRTVSCDLWKADAFSGKFKLLKQDIALTGTSQAYELQSTQSIRFSSTQDYKDGINIVYFDPTQNKTVLLRVSLNLSTIPVTSEIELNPGDQAYRRYVV